MTIYDTAGKVRRLSKVQGGIRVHRHGSLRTRSITRAASWQFIAALLLPTFLVCLVPETIASGVLKPGALRHDTDNTPPGFTVSVLPGDDGVQCRHIIAPGDTFAGILSDHGLSSAEIRSWQQAAATIHDLDHLQARHSLVLTFARDQGRLTACDYEVDRHAVASMRLAHGQIRARMKAMPQLAAVRVMAARVDASLATSATAVGIPPATISELAELFGWEIDLTRDLRPEDEFRIVYAELRDQDGRARPGDVLAAEIRSGGRRLSAFRFENERGESEYYDEDGYPLNRPFLKYPVDFVEISSQFSASRWHPIWKRARPHRGVDFAAPAGTPVHAVADGVVTFAGRNGEYGNQVGIDHGAPYGSSYSHLQRIARGVRVGGPVRKGQVIGYVGRTGIATGPHLHFMMFKDGDYVDPLRVKIPVDERLAGAALKRFFHLRADLGGRLFSADAAATVPALVPALLPPAASLLDLVHIRPASNG